MTSPWIRAGAVWTALGVGLGAFGAHGLADRVDAVDLEIWRTGVLYHLLHGLGLVAFGLWRSVRPGGGLVGWLLGLGSLVFSATLYAIVLGGPRWLGAVTPLGGVAMIAGWLVLAWQARPRDE